MLSDPRIALDHFERKLEHEIDAWDLWDTIRRGGKVVVIDARGAEAYTREHIPGAVSFPHRSMTAESTSTLDRDYVYISYCDGIGCNASTKGAANLARLGFRVKEMIGGLDWWKRDGYATEGEHGRAGIFIECAC